MKLYVHIPFCHAKCAYCDFYSTPQRKWMEPFVNAAIAEWRSRSENLTDPIDTLYFGGGTPSSLPPRLLKRLLDSLPSENLREATIEANPENVTADWVRFITSETPFRRVSMGVQSFCDAELQTVGRRHSAARAAEAIDCLRRGGISNLSCDLIYGLPGQTTESWTQSLDRLIGFQPEHISAYLLSYEPGTRLDIMRQRGKVTEADEETAEAMYSLLCDRMREAGYRHYEISNFALPGCEAVHNSAYWDNSPYIGLGPGAHSFDGMNRSFNPPSLKDYIAAGGLNTTEIEEESPDNRFNDLLITRLRTLHGLHPDEVKRLFGRKIRDFFTATAESALKSGDLTVSPDGAYVIPESRWLTSNAILLPFIRV